MLYLTHVPAQPLRDSIEYLWLLGDSPSHGKELIVPSGTLELAINLHQNEIRVYEPQGMNRPRRLPGIVLSGAYSRPFGIDTAEHTLMMGVHFRPGGAFPFLRSNVGEVADTHLDAHALWGSTASLLRERLCSAASHAERFTILEDTLRALRRTNPRPGVHFAISKFMNGDVDVRSLVGELGLSHRRFVEVFTREVGTTPKLFCRILRFQRVLTIARTSPIPEWARLAADAGYFDQPHLIRDFSEFCGMRPSDYLRSRTEPVKENHVALT
jgi:AraC-like DNA-binding protein